MIDADALIVAHVAKAKALARRLSRRQDDHGDIVGEALFALVDAAHTYRDDRGATFWTWAHFKITRHLQECRRTAMRRGGWVRKFGPGGGWVKDYAIMPLRRRWDDDDNPEEDDGRGVGPTRSIGVSRAGSCAPLR